MNAATGRRPVLATLSASQIPHTGPTSAVLGLSDGVDAALNLAKDHGPDAEKAFADALRVVRSDPALDADYSSSWARGFALIRDDQAITPGSTR